MGWYILHNAKRAFYGIWMVLPLIIYAIIIKRMVDHGMITDDRQIGPHFVLATMPQMFWMAINTCVTPPKKP